MLNKLVISVFLVLIPLAGLTQAPSKVEQKKARPSAAASRAVVKAPAKAIEPDPVLAEAVLSPAALAIAKRVHLGRIACEMDAIITMAADAKSPGYFDMVLKNHHYRMSPVETSTGAIRLEDPQSGAVWLQLSNKSMLMNQKLGQRLADECMSPDQALIAEMHRKNPPPSILDPVIGVATK